MTRAEDVLATVVREQWGRLVALLLARYRRLDLVEDALGDAVEAAARTWPRDGIPDNPAGWLSTAASRRVLDRLRAESMAARMAPLLVMEAHARVPEGVKVADSTVVEDDLLRLVLMCTHPALAPEVAAALALRLVLGVSTADVARLFLVSEATMAARITRGKRKVVAAGIPFAIPTRVELPTRLETVGQVAYLAFTAGYAAGSGEDLMRTALAGEAIRLVRVVRALVPESAELGALLALCLLQHSRREAREGPDGDLVLLPDQDRRLWRREDIEEGLALARGCPPLGSAVAEGYRLQALIAAEHASAPTTQATRWPTIVRLYDSLCALSPSPAVRLARAVAIAEADGPLAAVAALDALDPTTLPGHRLPAVRAELLTRADRPAEALAAYQEAIARCPNDTERRHLAQRLARL